MCPLTFFYNITFYTRTASLEGQSGLALKITAMYNTGIQLLYLLIQDLLFSIHTMLSSDNSTGDSIRHSCVLDT